MRRVLGSLAVMTVVLTIAAPAVATPPGRNGLIVFGAETRHSGYELFTIRRTGAELTRLTHIDGDAVHPDWSPNGRWIVFEIDHPSGPLDCSVVMMDADGSELRDLSQGQTGCEGQPSFTPDGLRIVFGRYDDVLDEESIWSMDLDGSDRTKITTGVGKGVTDPNVSPDGQVLSFIEYSGEELEQAIATVPPGGGDPTTIVPFEFDVAVKHDWAPNGRRLVFTDAADDFDRPANIATVRPDGTGLRYLTDYRRARCRAYVGGYAPNGNWIVFRLEIGDRSGLFRMHPNGKSWREIIPLSHLRPRFIDWGPKSIGP